MIDNECKTHAVGPVQNKYARSEQVPNNECCQCHAVGGVQNKYARSEQEPIPISWRCMICRNFVCINCVLTIPGSVPVEIYEDTLCSLECRRKGLASGLVKAEQV